jgi:uncharacterized protein YbjT (DUF2867 family)
MIVVTGATGLIGSLLIGKLAQSGAKVRAVCRNVGAAELPSDVTMFQADFSRPETWDGMFDGVETIFLNARATGLSAVELLAHAKRNGVERVVTLSAINVDDPLEYQPSRFRGDRNKEVEDASIASGLRWVSLRPAPFAQNSALTWAVQIRSGNIVRGPYPGFAEAPIHEQDLAEAAAQVILDCDYDDRKIDLTGPQTLTHREMVGIIGESIGRPLRYEQIPPDTARSEMIQLGIPAPLVEALVKWYRRGSKHLIATATPDLQEIIGFHPKTYAEWVGDNATIFDCARP